MSSTTTHIPVIECRGSAREVGRAHGESARDLIGRGLGRWRESLAAQRGDVDGYIADFLARTSFVAAIETHAPHVLEELHGIAEGASQPFEVILAYNLMDEEWSFRTDRLDGLAPGCTVVAVAGAAIGQTMDIPTIHDGTQIVLAVEPNHGPSQRLLSAAGMLGLTGANSAGVGVVVNNLNQLPSSAGGLPVQVLTRRLLEHETADEAARWTESVPHAVGQHYLIADPNTIISLEGHGKGVACIPVTDRYVHANHPLACTGTRPDTDKIEFLSNTHVRHDRAQALIGTTSDQPGLERILEDRDAPISREREKGFMTFGGISIGLTIPPTMRVTAGPPHESEWVDISWN
ncbi:MAG TPA: C45 family peptidase [Thermomicrobiales bacterium]|nr:C45 family peptidase [Thermomicrobiales bacterium]